MADSPIFIGSAKVGLGQVETANTNRDGTGTIDTIFSAGASGSVITCVRVIAIGTTTVGVVRLFLHDGSSFFLVKEIMVTAVTPSTSQEVFTAKWVPDSPLVIPAGYSLRASTEKAETFNVLVYGGDY